MMESAIGQLRDIHGAGAYPWWPIAPGWWLLAAGAVLLVLVLWRFGARLRLRLPPIPVIAVGDWRWDAARQLRALRRRGATAPMKESAMGLSELLRRIAIARHGRADCAGLTGEAWLAWLAAHDPQGFDWVRKGRLLLDAPYAPPGAPGDTKRVKELHALIDAAEVWVIAKSPAAKVASAPMGEELSQS